jgi:hypothetical protein
MPASVMVASNAERGNGNAPDPHKAPNSTDDTTLPACSAGAAMSKATKRFDAARAAAVTAVGLAMPSPGGYFSDTAKAR